MLYSNTGEISFRGRTFENSLSANGSPMLFQAVTWTLLPVLLWYAGASFHSSQDRMVGDMLTNSGGGQDRLFDLGAQLVASAIILALMLPSFREILGEFLRRRLVSAIVVVAVVSTLWSQQPMYSFHESLLLTLSLAFMFWLRIRFTSRELMEMLMLVGVCAAVLSIIAAVVFPSVGLDKVHDSAWQGVFYSKNHMGRIFVFLLTPGIHYRTRGSLEELLRGTYIVLMLLMIGLSQSRSALVAAALYLCFAGCSGVVKRFGGRDRSAVLILTTVAILVVGGMMAMSFSQIMELIGRDSTLNGRTIIWGVLVKSVAKRPLLGFGYQGFWAGTTSEGMNAFMGVYREMRFMASYAHSGYFAVLLDDGIAGLLVIILMIVGSLRNAWTCLQNQQEVETNWYIGLIILTVVYNIDEVTFMLPTYLPWMMFLLAVVGLADGARSIAAESPA